MAGKRVRVMELFLYLAKKKMAGIFFFAPANFFQHCLKIALLSLDSLTSMNQKFDKLQIYIYTQSTIS